MVGLVIGPGDTLELQNNAGDDLFVTGDTTFTFPTQVTNGGIYNVPCSYRRTASPSPATYSFIPALPVTMSMTFSSIASTTTGTGYHGTSVPRIKPTITPRLQRLFFLRIRSSCESEYSRRQRFCCFLDRQPGKKVALRWTWFSVSLPRGKQVPGFLNDLWVFDNSVGGWVPANVPTFSNSSITPRLGGAHGPLEGCCHQCRHYTRALVPFPARGGVAPAGRVRRATFSCLAARDSIAMGLKRCSMTYGNALPAFPLMLTARHQLLPMDSCRRLNRRQPERHLWPQGVTGRIPGGRWAAATTTDSSGNFWLFGGQGLDSAGKTGLLSDLWKYNASGTSGPGSGPLLRTSPIRTAFTARRNRRRHNGSGRTSGSRPLGRFDR